MSEFIYGRQPVLEALKAGSRTLHKLWLLEGAGGEIIQEIQQLAHAKSIPFEWARREKLDKQVQGNHQGVVAEASAAKFIGLDGFLAQLAPEAPALLVALDEIQDPHNVGAILRSAGFFGVAGAIVPKWRNAPVGETAARVSSGAIEHVPLMRVTNLAQSIKELQDMGFEVIGADMEGDPISDYKMGKRCVIVFGGEGTGLRRLVRERCDKLLKIPGAGKVASLNVAATAAIFLFEFCRAPSHR
jgi:23S rRNA (guanosine2251-2'-O)-methyltransferase